MKDAILHDMRLIVCHGKPPPLVETPSWNLERQHISPGDNHTGNEFACQTVRALTQLGT